MHFASGSNGCAVQSRRAVPDASRSFVRSLGLRRAGACSSFLLFFNESWYRSVKKKAYFVVAHLRSHSFSFMTHSSISRGRAYGVGIARSVVQLAAQPVGATGSLTVARLGVLRVRSQSDRVVELLRVP